MHQVINAIERLSRSRLHIAFGSGYTSAEVRAYALQVQATESLKPALIVVDYVQRLRDEEGDGRMRERNVSAAARGLKDLSGELGVPVFALVQLNRNRATRVDKRSQWLTSANPVIWKTRPTPCWACTATRSTTQTAVIEG